MSDDPRSRDDTERQRDRVGASSGSDHPLPSRAARKVDPSSSFHASAGPVPRRTTAPFTAVAEPVTAHTWDELLHGRKPPRPPWARQPTRAAGSGRSELGKRSPSPLARSAKGRSFFELPCERRPGPAERPGNPPTHPRRHSNRPASPPIARGNRDLWNWPPWNPGPLTRAGLLLCW